MEGPVDPSDVPWADIVGAGQLDRVNLVLMGAAGQADRLAGLVYVVLGASRPSDSRPAFRHAVVLLPPDVPDCVSADVLAYAHQLRGEELDAHERDVLSRRLQVHVLASFETDAVLQAIAAANSGDFVIVVGAARYRQASNATSSPVLQAPEDRWIAPLIHLAKRTTELVGQRLVVLVDAGEYLPALERNLQALRDLDCNVWGAAYPQAIGDGLMQQLEGWVHRVERGDIVSVLAEVDATPAWSTPSKLLAKAQILHRGGRTGRALEFVRAYLPYLEAAGADLMLKLASLALAGQAMPLAQQLLEASAGELTDLALNEWALELTRAIPSAAVETQCLTWLARYFPSSAVLEGEQLRRLLLAARDGTAARRAGGPALPLDDYLDAVSESLRLEAVPDYADLIEEADARWPQYRSETGLAAALDARRRELPLHVALLVRAMDPQSPRASAATSTVLWAIERLILLGGEATREYLADAILFVLCYLAVHPADTGARERLDELLSVEVAGVIGMAMLAHALVRVADADAHLPTFEDEDRAEDERSGNPVEAEAFLAFYAPALAWLSGQGVIDPATVRLPESLVTVPAEAALTFLKRTVQHVIEQEQADDTVTLRQMLNVAVALAPHGKSNNADLEILRLVTSRLVFTGEAQLARDLVEAGLTTTHGRPDRLRLAWFAYGDVFHRMQNTSRALLAFACGLASHGPISPEQRYYETMGIVRVLRDARAWDLAQGFLDRAAQLMVQLGIDARHGHRIETMRLSLELVRVRMERAEDPAAWSALLRALDVNLQAVVAARDELATVLVMAVQVLQHAEALGVPVDAAVRERIGQTLESSGPITADLVRLAAHDVLGPKQLLERAQRAQQARYAEDVGFDVQFLVRAARAQLAQNTTLDDPTLACFAAELTADHAITLPGPSAGIATWLPKSVDEPAQTLRALSQRGVQIEVLALDRDERLVRISALAGELTVRREDASFSAQALVAWSARFPHAYGQAADDPNLFYTSMRELGLSKGAGKRAIFVLDTRLQRLPAQLLLVDDELLGRSTALALAPSLTWLHAAISAPPRTFAAPAAWISTAAEADGLGTLALLAELVSAPLEQHGIGLNTGARVPEHLRNARLVLVAAHGGLAEDNRYFQTISDEGGLHVSGISLARALEGAGVVVLFVCSGGRQDEHPMASTMVGLPKQLLDRGSLAVVASPWPLPAMVPVYWLPAFLAAWQSGATLIDANAAGNRAVGVGMAQAPQAALALTVYGNPFLRHDDVAGSEPAR